MASRHRRAEHSVLFDSPGPRTKRVIALANIIGVALVAYGLYALFAVLKDKGQMDPKLWAVVVDAKSWTNFFLPGLLNTFRAAAVAIVGAIAFGFILGVGRLAMNPLIRGICGVIVEFLRAVPVLLMMIFLWSFLGRLRVPSPDFWAVS
ncbi:MAG: hypothetical protein LBH11_06000, partial [Propionibacteriaceae bacterium]|nr:hypothetical protein [Propionibacteriaceae bacterium]